MSSNRDNISECLLIYSNLMPFTKVNKNQEKMILRVCCWLWYSCWKENYHGQRISGDSSNSDHQIKNLYKPFSIRSLYVRALRFVTCWKIVDFFSFSNNLLIIGICLNWSQFFTSKTKNSIIYMIGWHAAHTLNH